MRTFLLALILSGLLHTVWADDLVDENYCPAVYETTAERVKEAIESFSMSSSRASNVLTVVGQTCVNAMHNKVPKYEFDKLFSPVPQQACVGLEAQVREGLAGEEQEAIDYVADEMLKLCHEATKSGQSYLMYTVETQEFLARIGLM